ncbi:MAG: ATP-binding protein, partial [Candidatus Kapaibacterium sp.]
VLPAPSTLMMLLAFLGIGVTYLFLAALVITFGIRAAVELTSRYLHVWRRITLGSLLTILFLTGSVVLFDQFTLSDTSLLYRAALTALTFLVSLPVIIIDASVPDPLDHGPSFLYRLPRSSRSILFILGASAVVMSPLIATKQLVGDEQVARRMVIENAEVDTPDLTNTAHQLLATAGNHLREWQAAGHDTSALRDEAFLIWMDAMRQHPAWNAVIDVYNSNGIRESHFATLGAVSELDRIRPALDSELLNLRSADSSRPVIHILQSFTNSGAPAIVGGLQLHDTTPAVVKVSAPQKPAFPKPPSAQASVTARPLFVTISLWSELPALVTTRANIPLLPGSNGPSANPETSSHFIVAQYRPNLRRLTNSPSLDVPATVPSGIQKQLLTHRSLWKTTSIGGLHYQTLYYRATAKPKPGEIPTIVTVSVPEPSYASTLEFALRLNAIGLLYGALIVIVLLLVRQVATRRVRFTLHFRDRIFLIVLVIALVPLVVVTNVTRSLLAERAQVEEQDRLARDAAVIKDRMTQSIEHAGPSLANGGLQSQVDYLSQVIGRDFSVYDGTGRLKASSRPELYESSLLSSTLNSTAVEEVIFGARSFFTEPVQIGSQAYDVGYQPVMSANGSRLLAVLALATMDEQPRIEAEIARTTSFIYGTFAALGLILLGIGALFAARVASPILELIRATERVAQGKLQTSIPVTREDEIGDLMHAFNTMTRELERSREIVAQTERELAWKEMARQVAHEIKNPLTPMKLSVQHLEHAHEAKDPNFNTIFRRVIRTMREQIDVLTRIATEFAHFGAMPRRRWGAVDIRKVADSAVALFDAERSRIRFIIDVPKNLPRVHSDEEELRRAFVNLLRNSVQAIDGWGVIVLRARSEQGMVHIHVRDTGFGMQEETLKKVFDPNFSTKTSGMGLGLAIVKKTITDMAGTIRVESQPGQGTTFFIDLPARADLGEEG